MFRALLLLAVWSLGVLPLGAQQNNSRSLRVRFAAQQIPKGLGKVVMVAGEERSEAFALPTNNLSLHQKPPARQFVVEPEDKTLTLAKVALPEPVNDYIVLLVAGEETPYTAIVLPAEAASFRPGDVYLHNVSKRTVLGQVGTSKVVLPPRQGKVVRPAGAREGRFYDVAFGVREETGNRVISTTRWPVDERTRSYVFFYDDPKRKDVDFRAIDEFVPPENP